MGVETLARVYSSFWYLTLDSLSLTMTMTVSPSPMLDVEKARCFSYNLGTYFKVFKLDTAMPQMPGILLRCL